MPSTPDGRDEGVEYRDIAGSVGLCVGNDGSVWSCRRRGKRGYTLVPRWHRLRTPRLCRHKYLIAVLRLRPGEPQRTYRVHQLALEAFVGPRPEGCECCHNDGDHTNNALSNLRWDTAKANAADQARHGTQVRGSRVNTSKLSADD